VKAAARVRYRHAFEVRHPSYFHPEFFELLRRHRTAFVVADTAGKWTLAHEVTAPFVYVRLHGSRVLYGSDYTEEELLAWAARIRSWRAEGRDVYVYFDNDQHAYAPQDALDLIRLVGRLPAIARASRPRPRAGDAGARTRRERPLPPSGPARRGARLRPS
jgi:uncharacterized protein YecE (DUF72 family)